MATAELPLLPGAIVRAEAAHIMRAMANAAVPAETSAAAPGWLLPEQRAPFRRVLVAVKMFGGALLGEPTGAGKTWIALAAAAAFSELPPVCIVPAAVAEQWRRTARRIAIPIVLATHERASRGTLPRPSGLVIVDESHRFRNTGTRRYRTLARWLVGQRALLLSATPAVNRLADVAAQLRLILSDTALAAFGVPSICQLADVAAIPDAAAHVIVRSSRPVHQPSRHYRRLRMGDGKRAVELLDTLSLSKSPAVSSLVRGVLLRAAASSNAAFAGALRRYRLLLLHAADAAAAGVPLGRAALRSWIGSAGEQTALWPLLEPHGTVELDLADSHGVELIEREVRAGIGGKAPRVERLRQMLADGRRTLVFTGWRETALWLRDSLGPGGIAWCMGSIAGIGRQRMTRDRVLSCFSPEASDSAPRVLVATDVASEGLDLQGAERVVHYDLPWTPMRLAQRDGRAARLGNPLPEVEIVRFDPPDALDRRLRQTEILRTKGTLPTRAGLAGTALHRWRAALESAAGEPASRGIGCVAWSRDVGVLACVEIRTTSSQRGIGEIVWLDRTGESRDPARLADAVNIALTAPSAIPTPNELRAAQCRLAAWMRNLLRGRASTAWTRPGLSVDARKLARSLTELARCAARERNSHLMSLADDGLRFIARAHTAGEDLLISELAAIPVSEVPEHLRALPAPPVAGHLEVALIGAILFRSYRPPLR